MRRCWTFGYELHMICSTDSLIVPLTADVTTANMSLLGLVLDIHYDGDSQNNNIVLGGYNEQWTVSDYITI